LLCASSVPIQSFSGQPKGSDLIGSQKLKPAVLTVSPVAFMFAMDGGSMTTGQKA
jgi:hypothetical protein